MRIAIAAAVACLSIIGVTATAQVHAAVRKHTEIPAEPLDLALRTLAKDRGFQVVYLSEDVRALQTRGAIGDFTVDEALKKLLSDSRLEYKFVDENTISIFPKAIPTSALEERNGASASVRSDESSGDSPKSSPEQRIRLAQVGQGQASGDTSVKKEEPEQEKKPGLAEIVVTGTNIHGVTDSVSPMRTIDRGEIAASGVTTIEDLFKSVPENVGGMDSDTFRAGVVNGQAGGGYNRGYASGIDLRGLGSNSTLVLLNGQRLPVASSGFTVDISAIPLGIIDHIDILKDGASSIYGSDAVAGVVNIVTLQDFTGALTNVTGGTVTDGGKRDLKLDQMLGTSWSSGNIYGAYTFNAQGALSTTDRPATQNSFPQDAIPPVVSNQVYLALKQSLATDLDLHFDTLASDRRIIASDHEAQGAGTPTQVIYQDLIHVDDTSLVSNVALNYALTSQWRAVLDAQYALSTTKSDEVVVPPVNSPSDWNYRTRDYGADLRADGPLFELPGGSVRLAMGVSYRNEELDGVSLMNLTRHIESGYGEFFIPLVGHSNAFAGVRRLDLTVSDRYDRYSDFGNTNNPKVGILFSPHVDVDLRATYSTSFQAPLLAQIGRLKSDGADFLFPAPDADSPTGKSLQLLETGGGNPNLQPETAHSFTAGLDFHPVEVTGLKVAVDYFNIDFRDRIEKPSTSPFLASNPALYGPFLTRDPSLAAVEAIINGPYFTNLVVGPYNPANIAVIVDDRLHNAESVKMDGVDFDARYTQPFSSYSLNYGLDATYLLKYEDTLLAGESPLERLNTPYYPTKLRLRGSVGWSSSAWSSTVFANYTNSYTNNQDPTNIQPVASWLTFDGQVSYSTPNEGGTLSGIRVALSVQNILDRQPPYVQNVLNTSGLDRATSYNYDPVNGSLLGRYISLQIGKRW